MESKVDTDLKDNRPHFNTQINKLPTFKKNLDPYNYLKDDIDHTNAKHAELEDRKNQLKDEIKSQDCFVSDAASNLIGKIWKEN